MRALITGGGGFVGRHLAAHLGSRGDEVVVVDLECDVTALAEITDAVARSAPEAIYHLAALAHVGESWRDPARVLDVNVLGTSNVLTAARQLDSPPAVLIVSSAEVYGTVAPEQLPLTELSEVAPVSPYAASKAAAEQVALQAAHGFGQRVLVVRPFNHIGPGQAPSFAVPAFAQRILAARAAGDRSLVVGNLSPRRDFTDVRDVVAAYRLVVERGWTGEIYNVATGIDISMREIVDKLQQLAGVELELLVDDSLLRPVDIPVLRGDASKLMAITGWRPDYDLEVSLADVLASLEA